MSGRTVAALGRYALANNLRTPHTWVGFGLLAAVTLLGSYVNSRGVGAWSLHTGFLTTGAYGCGLLVLRSGIIAQREGGLQTFLRANFVSASEHVTGAVLSLLGAWLLVAAAVTSIGALLPGAGLSLAAWYGWTIGLQLGLLLPFVVMTELVSSIEVPLLVPGLLWAVVFMAAYAVFDAEGIVAMIPPTTPGSWESTAPLLTRTAVSWGLGFGAVVAGAALGRGR